MNVPAYAGLIQADTQAEGRPDTDPDDLETPLRRQATRGACAGPRAASAETNRATRRRRRHTATLTPHGDADATRRR